MEILSWRGRRQLGAALVVLAILAVPAVWLGSKFIPSPSCFDGRRNHGETGVDCGGPCAPCELKNPEPLTLFWARAASASAEAYDAVALVENPNATLGSAEVRYEFTLLDELGVIGRKTGSTFIYPKERLYVIEPNIRTSRKPVKVEFVISEVEWRKEDRRPPLLIVERRKYSAGGEEGRPRGEVETQIFNQNPFDFREAETLVVVFDEAGNAVGANKVLTDNFLSGTRRTVRSIWSKPLSGTPAKIEIIPRVNLFDPDIILSPR